MAYGVEFYNLPENLRPFKQRSFSIQTTPSFPAPQTDNLLLDYNDPYAVNSLADLILNEAGLNKKYPTPFGLQDRPGFDLADLAQRVQGAVGLVNESWVRPVAEKGLAGAGIGLLNTLQNIGETLDVVANPIKGAILDPDGPGKGFMRGLGTTKEGRRNYDFDIQLGNPVLNVVANIGAEILIDPLNWISFGAKALASTAAKSAVEVGEAATKSINWAKVADSIYEINEDVQAKMLRAAFASAGPGLVVEPIVKVVQSKLGQAVISQVARLSRGALEPYSDLDEVIPVTQLTQAAEHFAQSMDVVAKHEAVPQGTVERIFQTEIQRRQQIEIDSIRKVFLDSRTPQEVAAQLDELTLARTKGALTFDQYVDYAVEFGQQQPGYTYYINELIGEQDRLKALLNPAPVATTRTIVEELEPARTITETVPEHMETIIVTPAKRITEKIVSDEVSLTKAAEAITADNERQLAEFFDSKYAWMYPGNLDVRFSVNNQKELVALFKNKTGAEITATLADLKTKIKALEDQGVVSKYYSLLERNLSEQEKLSAQLAALNFQLHKYEQALEPYMSGTREVVIPAVTKQELIPARTITRTIPAKTRTRLVQAAPSDSVPVPEYIKTLEAAWDKNTATLGQLFGKLDELAAIDPAQLNLKKAANLTAYKLKISQARVDYRLNQHKGLDGLLQGTLQKHGLPNLLRRANSEKANRLAARWEYLAYGKQSYARLLSRIHDQLELKPIFATVHDVLQGFANRPLASAINRQRLVDEIIDKVGGQLLSVEAKQRYSLEFLRRRKAVRENLELLLQQYPDVAGHAHDASFDNLVGMALFGPKGPLANKLDLLTADGKVPVFMDIETTGLDGFNSQILQINLRSGDETINIVLRAPEGVTPNVDDARRLTGVWGHESSIAAYQAKFHQGLPDEYTGIQQALTWIRQREAATGQQVRLVGHNLNGFDRGFLAKRLQQQGFSLTDRAYFNRLPVLDTLELLLEKDGVKHLAGIQRDALARALNIYISSMLNMPLDEAVSGTIRRKFIQGIDSSVIGLIKGTRFELNRVPFAQKPAVNVTLDNFADTLRKELHKIKVENAKLGQLQVFFDKKNKRFVNPLTGKVMDFDGALHVTQLFSDGSDEAMQVASIKILDMPEFRHFFNQAGLSNDEIFELSGVARRLQRMASAPRHYAKVSGLAESLPRYIQIMRQAIASVEQPPLWMKQLRYDLPGTGEQYAMLQQLIAEYRRLVQDTYGRDKFSQHLKELLEQTPLKEMRRDQLRRAAAANNPGFLEGNWADEPEDAILRSDFFNPTLEKPAEAGTVYRDLFQSTPRAADPLQQRALLRDRAGLVSASYQAEDAAFQGLRELWNQEHQLYKQFPKFKQDPLTGEKIPDGYDEALMRGWIIQDGEARAMAEVHELSLLDADTLAWHIWANSYGRLTFGIPPYIGEELAMRYRTYMNGFLERADELAEAGLLVKYDETMNRIFLLTDNTRVDKIELLRQRELAKAGEELCPETLVAYKAISELPEEARGFTAIREAAEQHLVDMIGIRAAGSLGDAMYKHNLEELDNFLPDDLRKFLVPISTFESLNRFDSIRFNRSNIGSFGSRRQIAPFFSQNPLKNYSSTEQYLSHMFEAKRKFKYLFFDETHKLSNVLPLDQAVEMLHAHPELRVAALVKDAKWGFRMQEFKIRTLRDAQEADALGAVVMPPHTFIKAWRSINDHRIANPVLRALSRYVVGPMKVGYLSTLGFLMRNVVDSVAKNMILTEDPTAFGKMSLHLLQTAKQYHGYHTVLEQVLDHPDNVSKMVSWRIIDKIYEANPDQPIPKELFRLYHDFIEQGPSAGLSKIQQEELIRKIGEDRNLFDQVVYNNPWTSFIMDSNSTLEQVFRLSGYTWALTHGKTTDQAMYKILKTHFDYTVKSKPMMYAEYVVPFLSFTVNNTLFWMNTAANHGFVASLFRDIMTPIWDFDEHDREELERNRSLQYHMLAGNIVLPDNLIIKLNPSVMDTLKLLSDPTEWWNRVNALVRLPFEYAEDPDQDLFKLLATNMPFVGPTLQRFWLSQEDRGRVAAIPRIGKALEAMIDWDRLPAEDKGSALTAYDRTENILTLLLPSIFGGVMDYTGYGRRTYNRKIWYKRRYFYAPKVRRNFRTKTYHRRSYARRMYSKKVWANKTWAKRTYVNPDSHLTRVRSWAGGLQMQMPAAYRAGAGRVNSLIKRPYPKTKARLQNQMVPLTALKTLYQIKQNWNYIR